MMGVHMKTHEIRIGRRRLSLLYNYAALAEMTEKIENYDPGELVTYVKSPKFFPTLIEILARQGEEEDGRTLDVDAAWLARHMSANPMIIMKYQIAVNETLAEGMSMETEDDDDDDGETDVVLDDLKKKETAGG